MTFRARNMVLAITAAVTALVIVVIGASLLIRPEPLKVDAILPAGFPAEGFSHQVFEGLLRRYVDGTGHVDYDAWHRNSEARRQLDEYLAAIDAYSPESDPARFASEQDGLAYWMYAYNAFVIKAVLQRWPLDSVTDIKAPVEFVKGLGFFYRQRFIAGGSAYSLYEIENEKIRRSYRDPRVHFILNCGSDSCPILRPDLPTGRALEPFLQQAAVDFVSEPRNVRIDHESRQIILSEIFKWYRRDFVSHLASRGIPSDRGVIDYVASVAPEALRAEIKKAIDYEIVFDDYDWSINDTGHSR